MLGSLLSEKNTTFLRNIALLFFLLARSFSGFVVGGFPRTFCDMFYTLHVIEVSYLVPTAFFELLGRLAANLLRFVLFEYFCVWFLLANWSKSGLLEQF